MATGDEFVFDPGAFELRRGGRVIELEPQVLDVLAYLIEHRDRLVAKEELLDEVWGDRFVSESALTTRIKEARRAFGDDGQAQRFVKTVRGRGYRFIGPVVVERHAGADSSTPATGRRGQRATNLRAERTPLVGRSADIDAVAQLVDANRLVSLLGVGGTGKTRLARAVGARLTERFPDGVWFIDLVPVTDPAGIGVAIADAAGLSLSAGSMADQLASLLGSRHTLIILDNCEHVLDHVADLLDRLLDEPGESRFLVTSREPTGLVDEQRLVVQPLTVDEHGTAIDLFLACATRIGVPVDDDRSDVAELCRRLDGLPLSIELAAAQLRHLSVADLVGRLDRRFDLLVGGRRPSRHASLGAVLDDTWAVLDPDERTLLQQLAVLPGSFGLDDLEGLVDVPSAEPLSALARLTDRALVQRSTATDRPYRLLETVRIFAAGRGDDGARHRALDRHAHWCLDHVGSDIGDHWYDFGLAHWCRDHHDNLRAAEAHLLDSGRPDQSAELVAAAGLAMHIDEGARAADTLGRLGQHLVRTIDDGLRARLHVTGAYAAMASRSPGALADHGAAAIAAARRAGDPSILGVSLVLGSWTTIFRNGDDALRMALEAADAAESIGDARTADLADAYRSWYLAVLGCYDDAIELASAVLDRAPATVSYPTYAAAVGLASFTAIGDPDTAGRTLDRWLSPEIADSMWALVLLRACIQAAAGDAAAADESVQGIHRRMTMAGQDPLPDLLVPAAALAWAQGQEERAARWLGAVRTAGRPTQSFQATCVYRRLRDRLGRPLPAKPGEGSLTEVGDEALEWLARAADREPGSDR